MEVFLEEFLWQLFALTILVSVYWGISGAKISAKDVNLWLTKLDPFK